MKTFFYLIIILLVAASCDKNDPQPMNSFPEFILAGASEGVSEYTFSNKSTGHITNGDSVFNWNAPTINQTHLASLNLDGDDLTDITYGFTSLIIYGILTFRSLHISNIGPDIDGYEFAIEKNNVEGFDGNRVNMVKLFSETDTISSTSHWLTESTDVSNQRVHLSYFYNREYHSNWDDSVNHEMGNLFLNPHAKNKFIGIRKKVNDQYVYGYIECDFENYNNLTLLRSAFADQQTNSD